MANNATMRDVSHTAPTGVSAGSVWERGGEAAEKTE